MKHLIITLLAALPIIAGAQEITIPRSIKPGATIGLVTAASAVDSLTVVDAIAKIETRGYNVKVMPSVFGKEYGSFAVNDTLRAAAIMEAFADPEVDAIMSTRGGYGCNRLLSLLDTAAIKANPKWLIGYSDISVLHAMMSRYGLASLHAPMCGHIAEKEDDDESVNHLFRILEDSLPHWYSVSPHPHNIEGKASGMLIGGNMITVDDLAQTPYDIFSLSPEQGTILFIEDEGEKIHAIERILVRWHQSGALDSVNGIIVGEFTSYKPNDDFDTMEDMIRHWLTEWGYAEKGLPVMFGFPAGHGDVNYPLVIGSRATISITPDTAILTME